MWDFTVGEARQFQDPIGETQIAHVLVARGLEGLELAHHPLHIQFYAEGCSVCPLCHRASGIVPLSTIVLSQVSGSFRKHLRCDAECDKEQQRAQIAQKNERDNRI